MSKEEQPTDISQPSQIRCIISVISRQVHFTFSFIDNKLNQICWPQTVNMGRASHSYLFRKKCLKFINNGRMDHKNVPSFLEIKYRWWSPYCIDPPEEDTCLLRLSTIDRVPTCSGPCCRASINWFWWIPYEKFCRNIKTKILIIKLKSESLWID